MTKLKTSDSDNLGLSKVLLFEQQKISINLTKMKTDRTDKEGSIKIKYYFIYYVIVIDKKRTNQFISP